jgi:hypothetical protein
MAGEKENSEPADSEGADDKDYTAPGERLDPQRVKSEEGSWESAARRLAHKLNKVESDNADLRAERRQLREQTPDDDAVVLKGDEAERYRELEGTEDAEPLETLKTRAEENASAQERLQELERKETLRTVADAAGITNLDAFEGITNGEVFDVREETGEEGETVRRAYVAPDEETDAVPLEDYDPFEPYHASLFAGQQPEEQESDPPTFPEQKPGGNPPSDGVTKEEIRQRKAESGAYRL